jgi:SAM-dependent methyltransferase
MDIAGFYATSQDSDSQTSPDPVHRALASAVAELDLRAPLLDLGTGVGSHLGMLSQRGFAVGVDISLSAVRHARASGVVAVADGAHLPFADDSFAGAVCSEVLEHVADPSPVLGELARVLRRGAIAVVTTPNYSNLVGVHKLIADRRSGRHDYNPWGAHEGGFEAFMTGRRLWRAARPHFELVSASALDYGQALTGRWDVTDRLAHRPAVYARLERLVPWLERPHRWLPFLAWHGMHVQLVLRRP